MRELFYFKRFILLLCLFCQAGVFFAQRDSSDIPELGIEVDSSRIFDITKGDSTGRDSNYMQRFVLSKDALEEDVLYGTRGADDSIVFDYSNSVVYLYGDAFLDYGTISLNAGFIRIHLDSNLLYAKGIKDSSGKMLHPPNFKDGDQEFTSKRMRYNFKTKKGIIYEAVSKYSELFIRGDKTKFISAEGDSSIQEDVLYNKSAIFTTCENPSPHYGIRSSKIKIIPNKLAVIGPSHIELDGLPTPFWIPFGFFPISPEIHSGLIFPRDYTYNRDLGYGLRNIGWYFAINDYMDFTLNGDIYFNTPISYRIGCTYRYKMRYKYDGTLTLGYSSFYKEPPGDYRKENTKAFSIRYSHNQARKANPYHYFGGQVNIQTNGFEQFNYNSAQSVSKNTYTSNLNYRRTFPGKKYSLAIGFSHRQNTSTRDIRISLPQIIFNQPTTRPLKDLREGHQWYDDITANYTFNFTNTLNTKDSLLFKPDALSGLVYDAKHSTAIDYTFKLFKYINVTPNIRLNEYWHFRKINKYLRDSIVIKADTSYRQEYIVTDTIKAFTPFHEFNSGVSANTSLYGTLLFRKGWLRGIRHKITPSLNFTYSPDYSDERYAYLKKIDTDPDIDKVREEKYSVFLPGASGTPYPKPQTFNLTYNISNNLETKYFSRRDSSVKKKKLFDYFNINGSYNFSTDSFNASPISFSSYLSIINGISYLRFSMGMDPYSVDIDRNGNFKRVNVYEFSRTKHPLRFDYASFTLSTRGSLERLRGLFFKKKKNKNSVSAKADKDRGALFDLFKNFSINHDLVYSIRSKATGLEKDITRNTLTMHGNIPLSKNWAVNLNNIGYNFITKNITYPDLGITRDLHCWSMRFSWQPQRGTYTFFLGVRPGSMLDFIKVPYNRTNTRVGF